jgi:phosphoribosyl transferase-like protein
MAPERFRDRREAGRLLAQKLAAYANRPDVVVLALPRGGVPVAYEVARALNAPLDVFVVRKLGVPGYEELAMGAVAKMPARRAQILHLGVRRHERRTLRWREPDSNHTHRRDRPLSSPRTFHASLPKTKFAADSAWMNGPASRRRSKATGAVLGAPCRRANSCLRREPHSGRDPCCRWLSLSPFPLLAAG